MSTSAIAFQIRFGAPGNSPIESKNRPDPQEQKEIEELKRRDAEVRQHEAAHLAAAGSYAKGGAHYEYAVGGEVSVDTSKVPNDPEATIRKAQTIKRAALAPANPSAQDRQVAVQADRMALEAQQELAKKQADEKQSYDRNAATATGIPESAIIDLVI